MGGESSRQGVIKVYRVPIRKVVVEDKERLRTIDY
jgi:hypothetical protein